MTSISPQPLYSFLIEKSFKVSPSMFFNTKSRRHLFKGPCIKCTPKSQFNEENSKFSLYCLNKLELGTHHILFCKRENKLSLKLIIDESWKHEKDDEIDLEKHKKNVIEITHGIFRSESRLDGLKISSFFYDTFPRGIVYHSGQIEVLKSLEPQNTFIFIPILTTNYWIDNFFLTFFLRHLEVCCDPILLVSDEESLPSTYYGRYLPISTDMTDIQRSVVTSLVTSGSHLIIKTSAYASLTPIIRNCIKSDHSNIYIVPVVIGCDILPNKLKKPGWPLIQRMLNTSTAGCGGLRIDFDEPFSLKEFVTNVRTTNRVPPFRISHFLTSHAHVLGCKQRRIMATTISSLALAYPRKQRVTRQEVLMEFISFRILFQKRSFDFGFSGSSKAVLNYALKILEEKGVVKIDEENVNIIEDIRPLYFSILRPQLWKDILIAPSVLSIVDRTSRELHGGTSHSLTFSVNLVVKRALWLNRLTSVALLKPCDDIELSLYRYIDQLQDEQFFLRKVNKMNVNLSKKFENDEYHGEEDRLFQLSRKGSQYFTFLQEQISVFLRTLYEISRHLDALLNGPISKKQFLSEIKNIPGTEEHKLGGFLTLCKLGILTSDSDNVKLSRFWETSKDLKQFQSSIMIFLR